MPRVAALPPAGDLAGRVGTRLSQLLPEDQRRLGIALSGGGDSMALLALARDWAQPRGVTLRAATVDHGLRPESRAEAQAAGAAAAALGVAHDILIWSRPAGSGNLMAQARDARLALLGQWAVQHDLDAVALGHTADDVAETLLMRLRRGAGIDGLAAMAPRRGVAGTAFLRPMLAVTRAELRVWLAAQGIGWIDDPSNQNPRFDRARVRQAMAALGLEPQALAQLAGNMSMVRDALDHGARAAAAGVTAAHGTLRLPRAGFVAAPDELRRRLLVAAVGWVSGAPYPPRREATAAALAAVDAGRAATLGGALLQPGRDVIAAMREPAAARRAGPPVHGIWDRRWRIAPLPPGASVTALGAERLPDHDWRAADLSWPEAASLPAITWGDGRVLVPLLDPAVPGGPTTPLAVPLRGVDAFIAALSH